MSKKGKKRWLKDRGYEYKHKLGPFFTIYENGKVISRSMNLKEISDQDLNILNSPLVKALR